ncbi:kinesin family member 1B [Thecamonas trahens ATCC 50062]|uniref:Kinesin-like protein n=1 Tax=Thecamonas trahens ATCC 50062 TaxID=461836 RepID=A0A0L0DBZ8_THETB|nr:kinesin family member 1B [Thecamonas trahens ATCC 50062]KNC48833.1 kinesin family member 1B [Thecamonas trahens ATCC 50062]|eukprot:XP_013758253.1 kinesin family member 1B [Thecamonas trahens ATCC 50062]
MSSGGDNVQIAVRMRPFNERELALESPACVTMPTEHMVVVTDPTDGEKQHSFSFNYAYNSFVDAHDEAYASQEKVFDDLGKAYLEAAWAGYNTSVFAYGQTGAGKSYSMSGYGEELGIVPRGLRELFARIDANQVDDLSFRVEVSYLEIYMEKIRDLFNPKQAVASLKVRESPKLGIFVEGLSRRAVTSYEDVEVLMELGNTMRTVAQTNMNATSSRSHSVLTIYLTQTRVDQATMTASDLTSKINLIDLAGSERQNKTGATGKRLKEGSAINQSLTALGNVIEALADNCMPAEQGKRRRKRIVPYRDSALTRILQESLGGNAKTIMVAAISPAADNYKETLSTLRYANRASKIQNVAVINESPNDKVIRELKEEVARLKALVASGGAGDASAAPAEDAAMAAELDALRAQLAQQTQLMDSLGLSAADRRAEASASSKAAMDELKSDLRAVSGIDVNVDTSKPHLVNLANASIKYALDISAAASGVTFGSSPEATYTLGGILVAPIHMRIVTEAENGSVTCQPGNAQAPVRVNGVEVAAAGAKLANGDRLVIGNNHFLVYADGASAPFGRTALLKVYQLAMKENATGARSSKLGAGDAAELELDAAALIDKLEAGLVALMPDISEANAAAAALGKTVRYAPHIQPALVGGAAGRHEPAVFVRQLHLECEACGPAGPAAGPVALLDADTFAERLFNMMEVVENYRAFGLADNGGPDPFSLETDVLLGSAYVIPLALSRAGSIRAVTTPVLSPHGHYRGRLTVSIEPQLSDAARAKPSLWLQPAHVVDVKVTTAAAPDAAPLFQGLVRMRVSDEVIDTVLNDALVFEVYGVVADAAHPVSPFSLRHLAAGLTTADDLSDLSDLSDLDEGEDLELGEDELAALDA